MRHFVFLLICILLLSQGIYSKRSSRKDKSVELNTETYDITSDVIDNDSESSKPEVIQENVIEITMEDYFKEEKKSSKDIPIKDNGNNYNIDEIKRRRGRIGDDDVYMIRKRKGQVNQRKSLNEGDDIKVVSRDNFELNEEGEEGNSVPKDIIEDDDEIIEEKTSEKKVYGQEYLKLPEKKYHLNSNFYNAGKSKFQNKEMETLVFIHTEGVEQSDVIKGSEFMNTEGLLCCNPIVDNIRWVGQTQAILDVTNIRGLSNSSIDQNIRESFLEWENAIGRQIFTIVQGEVIGDLSIPNGINEIAFRPLESSITLAVTILRIVPVGDIHQIIESDIIFNDNVDWCTGTVNGNCFDFKSTATHEVGHKFGFNHVDSSECLLATMRSTSSRGETHKRDITEHEAICAEANYSENGFVLENSSSSKVMISIPLLIALNSF